MKYAPLPVIFFAVLGCGPGGDDASVTEQGPTTLCGDTGCPDTGPSVVAVEYMHPVAVGFEVTGVLYEDGTINNMVFDDDSTASPIVRLRFADADYFGADSEAGQAGHFCDVAAELTYLNPYGPGDEPFPNNEDVGNKWSYETNLIVALEFTDNQCGAVLDPALWGEGGVGIFEAFDNMHFGFGFGTVSDRLWEAFGGSTSEDNADIVDRMFGVYIAINDKESNWTGCDWGYGFLYEVDEEDKTVEDPKNPGYLSPIEVPDVGSLAPLPKGYLSTATYWYQDFPLMSLTPSSPWDFTHMSAAPAGGFSDCGDW